MAPRRKWAGGKVRKWDRSACRQSHPPTLSPVHLPSPESQSLLTSAATAITLSGQVLALASARSGGKRSRGLGTAVEEALRHITPHHRLTIQAQERSRRALAACRY